MEEKTIGASPASPRFKPYPSYKDSGVEWLGKIPAHWAVRRADSFLLVEKLQIEPSEITLQEVFHYSIPSLQEIGDGRIENPNNIDSSKLIIAGDRLLVSKLNPRKGVIAIATKHECPTMCSTELIPIITKGCDLRWAYYVYLEDTTRQRIAAVVRSATRSHQRAEVSDIIKLWQAVPSLDEQHSLAAFLDRETAKIDALIEKKGRLIELLQEKRTALITQAVTKGLDPTVPMKDSGVEWLGKIPTRWNVLRLKFLASINDEALSEKTDPQFEMIYVDIGGVDKIQGILEREAYLFETAPSRARRIVRDGDVIISTVRTYLRAITPIRAPECNLIVSTGFAVIRPASGLDSDYAAYALRATYFVENIVANSTGVSYPAIEASKVSSFSITFPELMEQQRITAFLDRETGQIDKLISRIREAITNLNDYRAALMSSAVTGKIDVRSIVA